MTEEFKFENIQERVLFNIARARKKVNIDEIIHLTGNSLNRKQVFNALDSLKRRSLIKKKEGEIIINFSNIMRIKKVLGEHWESNWENEWREIK